MIEHIELISYAVAGMIYAKMENDCFEFDFEGCSRLQIAMFQTQMAVHYFRIVLTWPLYVIEDFTVYVTNYGREEEEDDNDDGLD